MQQWQTRREQSDWNDDDADDEVAAGYKKTSLAKLKGDVTENQQVRMACDWLDY